MSDARVLHVRPGRIDNLDVSEDVDLDGRPIAVLLYTPDMRDTDEHHHVDLDDAQVRALRDWLGAYIARHQCNRRCGYFDVPCGQAAGHDGECG